MQEKNELSFEVLIDKNLLVVKEYGIVFKLIDEVGEVYCKNFFFLEYNGNDLDELFLVVIYVIQLDGKIIYVFLDVEYCN